METPHSLACALREALSQQHEASTPALVAHHNDGGTTRSFCVSTLALRAWITASVDVIASLLHPNSSSLVVALALPPCSAEESASMLLVALQPHWIFVPLDVRSPAAQLKSRLLDVGADVLITWEQSGVCLDGFETMTRLPVLYPSSLTMRIVCLSTVTGQLPQRSWLENCASPPLYVLPTSGTTGHAKGVVGTRVGALERVFWSQHALPMDPQRDVVLRTTRLTFVDAVAEILGACFCRVPLVHLHFFHENNARLVDSVVLHSPRALLDVVAHWRVTRFTVVPTVLRLLLHAVGSLQEERGSVRGGQRLASLQVLLVSGEPLPLRVVDECFRVVPHVTLVNLYGSTEVSGDVTWKMLRAPLTLAQHEKWSRLGMPIGESPVCAIGASTQIRLEREADDTTGDAESLSELWVRGGAVAAGYVVDKKLVRPPGKWICDSESGVQWFRMGDLCRVVDGELFLCGRKDRQVKVRGNRLQLEDVERAIKHAVRDLPPFADVCDVIVSPVDTPTAAADSEMKLLAILLVDGDLASGRTRCGSCQVMSIDVLSKRQLYDRLAGECGELFVPHAVAAIDASRIPRHSNGKVDLVRTHALCEDHRGHGALQNSVSPAEGLVSTDTRTEALALVCEVLGSTDTLNDSDRRATWLQLGGNSLQAALLSWEADHRLNTFIPAPDIVRLF
jgi:acyl-CoA synthetase (AMP-forming)/AMP-acid ligase II